MQTYLTGVLNPSLRSIKLTSKDFSLPASSLTSRLHVLSALCSSLNRTFKSLFFFGISKITRLQEQDALNCYGHRCALPLFSFLRYYFCKQITSDCFLPNNRTFNKLPFVRVLIRKRITKKSPCSNC